MEEKRILHLVLKKRWFLALDRGKKKEEYREIKDYWEKRLDNKKYDIVIFYLGYRKDRPRMCFHIKSIKKGYGKEEWGAEFGKYYYIIRLGKRIY